MLAVLDFYDKVSKMIERWDGDNEFDWQEELPATSAPEPDPSAADQQTAEVNNSAMPARRSRTKLKVWGATIVAGLMPIGIAEVAANTHLVRRGKDSYYLNIFSSVNTVSAPNGNATREGCPPVSRQEINNVEQLLNRPENPLLKAAEHVVPANPSDHQPETYVMSESAFDAIAEKAARENGLTLVNEQPYIKRLERARNIEQQLSVVNEWASRYGFAVRVDTGRSQSGLEPLTEKEFRKENLFYGFANLMDAFSSMPVEEIKATGLKKMVIVKEFVGPDGKDDGIAAQAVGSSRVNISVPSLSGQSAADDLRHELGHLADYNYCGEFGFDYYDPQYTNLNPNSFEYGVGSYWQNATESPYGSSNMREDKAEMYKEMLGYINYRLARSPYEAIREKYGVLLARLNEQTPGLVSYLQAISSK